MILLSAIAPAGGRCDDPEQASDMKKAILMEIPAMKGVPTKQLSRVTEIFANFFWRL